MSDKKYLTIEDVIYVLQHYNLEHKEFPSNHASDDQYYGICLGSQKRMIINNSLTYERVREVIVHEIVHAYADLTGMHDGLSLKQKESLTDKLTEATLKKMSWYKKK